MESGCLKVMTISGVQRHGLCPLLSTLLHPSSPSLLLSLLPVSPFVRTVFMSLPPSSSFIPVCASFLSTPLHPHPHLPAQASSLPSSYLLFFLPLSISPHQLQRAVSVVDLEGTCLLRWNKIARPPSAFVCVHARVYVCVCGWCRL